LLFGGQVAVVMLLATGPTLPMLILLLAIIATSISIEVFLDAITTQLDRLAFSAFPRLLKERAELRTTASTLPRINPQLDILRIDEQEFIHYTRRALSNFGDLARLATSPLIHLPAVASRVTHNGNQKDALSQAIELKAILMESIERLKPRNQGDFGTSDEWRYYNALYFPYIAGIKPYSRRSQHTRLDSPAQEALQWFRTHVPERTLYNWQNAASRLIAQDLRQACMQDQT
ncbi:MAG: hypothetical protein J2P37_14605, partial [Ktedonobacteraceae bacterium]|nr:hypothetical protein [Ktedonobacteraceae bacterium]